MSDEKNIQTTIPTTEEKKLKLLKKIVVLLGIVILTASVFLFDYPLKKITNNDVEIITPPIENIQNVASSTENHNIEKVSTSTVVVDTGNKTILPTQETQTPPRIREERVTPALNYEYGISVGETFNSLSDNELQKRLDDIVSLGLGWLRVDFDWSSIQPQNAELFNWTAIDRLVTEAHKRNIKVLPILTYTPMWARSKKCPHTDKCEPNDPRQFAAFAKASAERYTPKGVEFWEIWNEPNMGFFWSPAASPEYYVQVLKAAYTEIHSVNPNATVISGGLGSISTKNGNIAPRDFLERMYIAQGKSYFDGVGVHPYSFPASPTNYKSWSLWSQMNETEWSLRSIMIDNGDSAKKLWPTEFGAPTNGPGNVAESNEYSFWRSPDHVTEAYQALIFQEAIAETRENDWDGPLFFYSYKDRGIDTSTVENFFGLLRFDGSKKPAYTTLKNELTN